MTRDFQDVTFVELILECTKDDGEEVDQDMDTPRRRQKCKPALLNLDETISADTHHTQYHEYPPSGRKLYPTRMYL